MTIAFQRYNGSEWVTETESSSGGVTNHTSLTNLAWLLGGHTGTANKLAGFDSSGDAAELDAVTMDDTAYNATSWDSNSDGATKNAIRDKFVTNDTAIGLNTTHRTSNGTDHSYIDQSVTTSASPTFAGATIGTMGSIGFTHGGLTSYITGTLGVVGLTATGAFSITTAASVGSTLTVTGIATLGDGSLLKTSAAPTTDAMIANKKYVDDQVATGLSDPMTTRGDVVIRDATNTTARLAVGANTYVLTSDGTDIAWAAAGSGSGDVTAAASMTDNTLIRGDGGVKGVQDSGIVIDDSDNVSAMGTLGCGAITSSDNITTSDGVLFVKEQAAADADVAGYGQIWVKTATPNTLWFTDDAGTDTQLGAGGGGGSPGGSTTELQYNNAGAFGGISSLTWDGSLLQFPGNAVRTQTYVAGNSCTNIGYGSFGSGNLTGTYNTAFGYQAAYGKTSGNDCVFIGDRAGGTGVCAGNYGVVIGAFACQNATNITDSVFVGVYAGRANSGNSNTGIGARALLLNTSGGNNTAVGYYALDTITTSSYCTAVGANALGLCTGASNTAIGSFAGNNITTGQSNTLIGASVGGGISTTSFNAIIGSNLGKGALNKAVVIGNYNATSTAATAHSMVVIGNSLMVNNVATGTDIIAIGYSGLSSITSASYLISLGYNNCRGVMTASNSIAIGWSCLGAKTSGNDCIAIGNGVLAACTTGQLNEMIGKSAGNDITEGSYNTGMGSLVLEKATTANFNCGFGRSAGRYTTGSCNSYYGYSAGTGVTSGSYNCIFGYRAADNLTTGSYNTVIGGRSIDAPVATGSDQLVIANVIFGTGCSGTGTTAAGKVGIKVNNPARELDVNGDITLESGSGDYYSNDGSQGFTGTGAYTSFTIKNGIITAAS